MRSLKLLTVAAIALCSSSALACGMPPNAGLSLADAMEKIEAPAPVVVAEVEAPAEEPAPVQEAEAPEQDAEKAPEQPVEEPAEAPPAEPVPNS